MSLTDIFQNQRFLALETYRKTGIGVATAMGFVVDGDSLLVRTQASTGKVKRMRANPNVRIALSNGRGDPLGAWQPATAIELPAAAADQARALFLKKYGLIWWWLEIGSEYLRRVRGLTPRQWTVFRISDGDI